MVLSSQQSVFIIGSPRSGTTMLQILLGSHPQVATTVELSLFDQYVAPWLERWETEMRGVRDTPHRRGLPTLWTEADNDAFLHEFLEQAYAKVLGRWPGRTHLLDKNPSYSLHVPVIKRLLPGARFIHMLRDGRDVATSLVAASASMGFGTPTVPDAARLWKRYVRGAFEGRQFGADYLELRYEDFLGGQTALYRRVLEFCGLSADDAWIQRTLEENTFEKMKERRATADPQVQTTAAHYAQGRAGAWEGRFSPADRFAFDHVAGDLLRELKYAQIGWWKPAGAGAWLLPAKYEARRRGRIAGLALTLLRRGLLGQRLPDAFRYFED